MVDIRDVSLRFLTHRSRSSGEMRKHLLAKGFSEESAEEEMAALEELRYLDDADYVRQYADCAFSKGRGIRRIRQELLEKGVRAEALEDWLSQDSGRTERREAERQRALQQAEKLLPDGEAADEKRLAKVGRRLVSLGYDSDTVYYVLGILMKRQA